jgi:Raf kinase inhibitor-like YbhB/YbcL family protein
MKRLLIIVILIIAIGASVYYYFKHNPYFQNRAVTTGGEVANMIIKSTAFKNGEVIPKKYTCDGENINFPLEFENIPYGTKSLVLIMDDPDSPSKDFTHWVMFNIQPYTTNIPENFKSDNVTLGKNDFGNIGYGGPCPMSGNHKYNLRLYAINSILLLQRGATKQEVLDNIKGQILESAVISGLYQRHYISLINLTKILKYGNLNE